MLFLAAHPAQQQRLHGLALSLLPDSAVCADYEQLRQFDDFEALATEALRLKPVVAFLALEARRDTVIGQVALPRGTRYFYFEVEWACDPAAVGEVLNFTMMPSRMPVRLKRRAPA